MILDHLFASRRRTFLLGDEATAAAGGVAAGLCSYYGAPEAAGECAKLGSEWASAMEEGVSNIASGAGCHSDDPNAWCNAPPPEQTRALCPIPDVIDQAIAPMLAQLEPLSGFDWSDLPAGTPARAFQSFAYMQCQKTAVKAQSSLTKSPPTKSGPPAANGVAASSGGGFAAAAIAALLGAGAWAGWRTYKKKPILPWKR